jgi:hypothetical protein
MAIAAGRRKTGSVRLLDMQRWSTYFGKAGAGADFTAYDIGAAFDYFVIETFGEDRFRSFLVDLGRSRSLEASVTAVLGRSLDGIEAEWMAVLDRVEVQIPRVLETSPTSGATAVPMATREIWARFDVPMDPGIRVGTDCREGICFDHASWKDEETLVIRIDAPLRARHHYALTLGTTRGRLRSKEGVEAPLTRWEFDTGE